MHVVAGPQTGSLQRGSQHVVELHGTAREVLCIGEPAGSEPEGCGWRAAYTWAFDRLDQGDDDPSCPQCGRLVKSATVSFGQMLPTDVLEESVELARTSDVFLAIGSSLVVHPAAGLPQMAKRAGAKLAIINRDPTDLDPLADVVLHEPIGVTLSAIDAALCRLSGAA